MTPVFPRQAVLRSVAEVGLNVDADVGAASGVLGGAVGAFLTTLVVGGILVAVAPDYAQRTMARVTDEPVESFLYGLLAVVGIALSAFVLVVTVVGIIVALPLLLVAYLAWAVGAAVAYLAVGDRLVGHDDGWLKPLLVGAGINGLLTLTGVGGPVAFAIGAAGFGAVLRDWLD